MTRAPLQLPVDAVEGLVRDALVEGGAPLVVTAPTGSGKSTRLPVWLADAFDGPVLVVQPRRVACRALAGWVAEQMGTRPGDRVGWHIRGERRESNATQVLFVTPGMALRRLSGGASPWAALLIDEFHERGWETDLLVALARAGRIPIGQLVLTSATLAADELTRTLDGTLVTSEGRTWPVDIEWDDEPGEPTRRDLADRVADALRRWCEAGGEGDALVFLPGRGEIADAAAAVGPIARRWSMDIVPVHGGVPPKQLQRALAPGSGRRVYLATNVAETSLTLPGVRHVIDSGLERRRTHRAGRTALSLLPIASDAMDQRTGRAGRVAAGTCRRLFSRRYRAAETTAPELSRMELDEVIVQAARCGLAPNEMASAPWVTPPPAFAVDAARERLEAVGAVSGATLTRVGVAMADWPTGPMNARWIAAAPSAERGVWCDVAAWLESRGTLWRPLPGEVPDEVDAARRALAAGAVDEVRLAVRAIRFGDVGRHKLDGAALARLRDDARRLRAAVGVQPKDPVGDATPVPSAEDLAAHAMRVWPDVGYVRRDRAPRRRRGPDDRTPWANADTEIDVRSFGVPWRLEPGESPPSSPTAGAVLDVVWLGRGASGVRGVGSSVLPCRPATLAECGLGEEVVAEADARSGRARVNVVLGGVQLATRDARLRGDALRAAAVERVQQGRWMRGVWDGVEDAIHVHAIVAAWPAMDLPQPVKDVVWTDAAAWLDHRLAEMGVEVSDDLALVEPEDLIPDLTEWTGLQAWDLDPFVADFPRVWDYLGAKYLCTVRVSSRKVILEPLDRKTRRGGEPTASVVPSFRGFKVQYRSASRVVPIRG